MADVCHFIGRLVFSIHVIKCLLSFEAKSNMIWFPGGL